MSLSHTAWAGPATGDHSRSPCSQQGPTSRKLGKMRAFSPGTRTQDMERRHGNDQTSFLSGPTYCLAYSPQSITKSIFPMVTLSQNYKPQRVLNCARKGC